MPALFVMEMLPPRVLSAATLVKMLFAVSVTVPAPRMIKSVVPAERFIAPTCVIPFPKSVSTPGANVAADPNAPIPIAPVFASPIRTFVPRTLPSAVVPRASVPAPPARPMVVAFVLCFKITVAAVPAALPVPPICEPPGNTIVSAVMVATPVVSRKLFAFPKVTAPTPASTEREPAPEFTEVLFETVTPPTAPTPRSEMFPPADVTSWLTVSPLAEDSVIAPLFVVVLVVFGKRVPAAPTLFTVSTPVCR